MGIQAAEMDISGRAYDGGEGDLIADTVREEGEKACDVSEEREEDGDTVGDEDVLGLVDVDVCGRGNRDVCGL